jgi:hypothetical protein
MLQKNTPYLSTYFIPKILLTSFLDLLMITPKSVARRHTFPLLNFLRQFYLGLFIYGSLEKIVGPLPTLPFEVHQRKKFNDELN